jgi:signal transduction histidine kinase
MTMFSDFLSPEAPDVSQYLARAESRAEHAKTRWARTLHDDLNSLLVGAAMDTSATLGLFRKDGELCARLERIRHCLSTAIDMNRALVEELRPSLLDTFGLFAALRWHYEKCSANMRIRSQSYPDDEPAFSPSASTVLFRIVQEALTSLGRHPSARSVVLHVDISNGELCIHVAHDGAPSEDVQDTRDELASQWLIEHRVLSLGGRVSFSKPVQGGVDLKLAVPLRNLVRDDLG